MRAGPVLAAVLLLAGGAAPAQETQDAAGAAEAGRRLYVMACQRCHGLNLVTNGIGFDLRSFPAHDKERFVRSVTNGKNAMPAWGGTLQPGQIELIWAYVGAVNGWPAEPVPAR